MAQLSAAPSEILVSAWRHRELIALLIRREVSGRYRGSRLGMFWSLLHPLLMLTVYTFVFSVVFKARWHSGSDSKTEFALVLFIGLMAFNLFSECFNRAPGLILSNVNFVKKVVFPLEVLPWVTLGSALLHALISLCVWLVVAMLLRGFVPWTALFAPLAVLPLVFINLGLSWFLSSLGVFLRDIAQVVGLATTVLMFLSPIFYPATALPERYRVLIYFNPLTPVIENLRDALYWGQMTHLVSWAGCLLFSLLVAALGFAWFQKTRRGLADVL